MQVLSYSSEGADLENKAYDLQNYSPYMDHNVSDTEKAIYLSTDYLE